MAVYNPCSRFSTRHLSHAKVITLKVIPRRPFLQWTKAPQLSDSLNETRTCPQISIVSTGLQTQWGQPILCWTASRAWHRDVYFLLVIPPKVPLLCNPVGVGCRVWYAAEKWNRSACVLEPNLAWSNQSPKRLEPRVQQHSLTGYCSHLRVPAQRRAQKYLLVSQVQRKAKSGGRSLSLYSLALETTNFHLVVSGSLQRHTKRKNP